MDYAFQLSRRRFLAAVGGGAAAAFLLKSGIGQASASKAPSGLNHAAWVWQFSEDGDPEFVRSVLADHGLGVLLKVYDGTSWMGRWDRSPLAIRGPEDVRRAAAFFESRGVPFHAWGVVRGFDAVREGQMTAETLEAGARSFVFDVEPPEGDWYWHGSNADALIIGREVRRRRPNAWLSFAPDCRPWQLEAIPTDEFASFSNEIAPQVYWELYNNSGTRNLLRQRGIHTGPDGITPELLLDVTHMGLRQYGLPIRPIGEGIAERGDWQRFVDHAYQLGMDAVSVWRFGTAHDSVWSVLRDMKPVVAQVVAQEAASQPHTVQSAAPAAGFYAAPVAPSPTPLATPNAATAGAAPSTKTSALGGRGLWPKTSARWHWPRGQND